VITVPYSVGTSVLVAFGTLNARQIDDQLTTFLTFNIQKANCECGQRSQAPVYKCAFVLCSFCIYIRCKCM